MDEKIIQYIKNYIKKNSSILMERLFKRFSEINYQCKLQTKVEESNKLTINMMPARK